MEKKFDSEKTYAIALGGGGAKGAYEIGVWRSLEEEGLRYNAVSGTSVGALNGALMTMRSLERAEELWKNIRYSDVMDVNDDTMRKVFSGELKASEIGPVLKRAYSIIKDGGFDVTPLRRMLQEYIDPERIKSSDVDFYVVTFSITDKKEEDIIVRELPSERICDMLLASAYFPAFKNEPFLGGKRYTDGGVADTLPVTPLIENGYTDIIAVRLTGGIGREKRVRTRKGVTVQYIEPKRKLGNTLKFDSEQSRHNIELGYYDAKRFVYGLCGDYYYVDRTMTEREAYNEIMKVIEAYAEDSESEISLRAIHETVIPKIAREHGASGDYYDVMLRYLEHAGEVFGIPEFRIIKDTELLDEVRTAMGRNGMGKLLSKRIEKLV